MEQNKIKNYDGGMWVWVGVGGQKAKKGGTKKEKWVGGGKGGEVKRKCWGIKWGFRGGPKGEGGGGKGMGF